MKNTILHYNNDIILMSNLRKVIGGFRMLENNYYSIACNDYRYLLRNLDSEFYNNMAIECHQICEKHLSLF